MRDSILNFHRQFECTPKIVFPSRGTMPRKYIICGMGGSALSGDLVRVWDPSRDVVVWRDYGLPPVFSSAELRERLVIMSSYSGTTEETLRAFHEARKRRCAVAAITTGGKLLALARRFRVPHIILPDTGIQPRMASGFGFVSILALMREKGALREISRLAHLLRPSMYERYGMDYARTLRGKIPLVYASRRNGPLAYVWKVKLNETAKLPAFSNVVPELNHNEMTGFDPVVKEKDLRFSAIDGSAFGGKIYDLRKNQADRKRQVVKNERIALQKLFHAIVLDDKNDEPHYRRRLSVLSRLYRARGVEVTRVPINQKKENAFFGIFSSSLIADWTAYHLARYYHLESEEVPIVEEFKKLIVS